MDVDHVARCGPIGHLKCLLTNHNDPPTLRRHNQAKNHPKANILFWLFGKAIICEHVHKLELRKSLVT